MFPEAFPTANYHNVSGSVSDGDVRQCVQGHLSACPDLNTANTTVQNNIISLLKSCIDCGVDGFRFDGAKHIETPSDGSYASNFWPTVTDAAKNYYRSKTGDNLYMYGEILNKCGPSSRKYTHYTSYINVTDNKTGDAITAAVNSKNASSATKSSYTAISGQNGDSKTSFFGQSPTIHTRAQQVRQVSPIQPTSPMM